MVAPGATFSRKRRKKLFKHFFFKNIELKPWTAQTTIKNESFSMAGKYGPENKKLGFGLVWHNNDCGLFKSKSFFIHINISTSNNSVSYKCKFKCKNSSISSTLVSINTQFSNIWPIDRILSGATTLSQSEPGSDGNEGVLRVLKKLSTSVCLTLCPLYKLEEF